MEVRRFRTAAGLALLLVGVFLGIKGFTAGSPVVVLAYMCFALAFTLPGAYLITDLTTLPFLKAIERMFFGDSIQVTREYSHIKTLLHKGQDYEALVAADEELSRAEAIDPNLLLMKLEILYDKLLRRNEALEQGAEYFRQHNQFNENDERLIFYYADILIANNFLDDATKCLKRVAKGMANKRVAQTLSNRIESLENRS